MVSDWNGLTTLSFGSFWLKTGQEERKKSHGVQQMAKNFEILLTSFRKTLAYLGNGRLVKDSTSHADFGQWFSSRSHRPQLADCLCSLLREMGANPSPAHCHLSQLSIGWRNNVVPVFGLKRGRLKPWWLNRWVRLSSASKSCLVQNDVWCEVAQK